MLGLKWEDINWEQKSLRIQRQLKPVPFEGLQYESPKTKTSIRTIKLGANTITQLREYQKYQYKQMIKAGDQWQNTDAMFSQKKGSPIHPRRLQKDFKKVIADAGLPVIRFHDLRHTAASLMLNRGIPVIVVSKMLGHAKPSITHDTYGHLMPSMQDEAALIMDEIVTPILLSDLQTAP